jgi:hypothetical protein
MVLTSLGRSPDPRHDPLFDEAGGRRTGLPAQAVRAAIAARRYAAAALKYGLSTDCTVKRRLCREIVDLS